MMAGLSQDKLGEALGLTFQQVQKYEKGINRIGASRLFEIAKILGVPVQFFYDDADVDLTPGFAEPAPALSSTDSSAGDEVMALIASPDGMQLCRAFARISDASVRRRVLELVKTLADED